jgi:hypothetical protein
VVGKGRRESDELNEILDHPGRRGLHLIPGPSCIRHRPDGRVSERESDEVWAKERCGSCLYCRLWLAPEALGGNAHVEMAVAAAPAGRCCETDHMAGVEAADPDAEKMGTRM